MLSVQTHSRRIACDDLGFLPDEVLIVPWGDIESSRGAFRVDDESASAVIQAFRSKGVDLVIDFEHASLGGEFQTPDGKAPAAGWIKTMRAVPGRGIVARVRWNEPAAVMIRSRQYRYLSPVVIIDEGSRRVMELHSVALTNVPAIKGFPALVHKANMTAHSETQNMNGILDRIEGIIASVAAGELDTEGLLTALRSLADAVREPAGEANAGGPAESAAAHRAAVIGHENTRLRAELEDRDFDALITAHAGRIPPAQLDSFKRWWSVDRQGAERFIACAAPLVNTRPTVATSASRRDSGRIAAIHRGKSSFREAVDGGKKLVCSERAWINQALRDANMARLTDDEVRQHSITVA